MFGTILSAPDPYTMSEVVGSLGNSDLSTKTLASQTLNNGIKNGILLIAGQSNVCDNVTSAFTIVNTGKIDNLNPYNGAIYTAADPLLGCSAPSTLGPGCFALRLADKLITAGKFDRVILLPIGINGTTAANWQTTYANRLSAALSRLTYRGMIPSAILWGQGEEDGFLGTSSAAYQASVNAMITATRALGYSGPWFIASQTWRAGVTNATIQVAQAALVNHGSTIWAGPNADSLNATNRQADNTHWNDTGSDAYAGLWQTALGVFGAPF